MRKAAILAMVALWAVFGSACNQTATTPTPPATTSAVPTKALGTTATATATVTPTPLQPDPLDFRPFAREIEAAVATGDADTLVALTEESEIDCRQVTQPVIGCPPDALGTVQRGIPIGPWRSEYVLKSVEEYGRLLSDFFDTSRSESTDRYGSGAARLFGIGYRSSRPQQRNAVITAIGPEGRAGLLLQCEYRQDSWHIFTVVVARTWAAEEMLSPALGHVRIGAVANPVES